MEKTKQKPLEVVFESLIKDDGEETADKKEPKSKSKS